MFLRLPRPVFDTPDPAPQPDPTPPTPVAADPPAADPAPEPTPAPTGEPPKWALQRIQEEASARRAAEARAAAAEAMLARANPAAPASAPQPPQPQNPQPLPAAVHAQAEQIVLDQAREDIMNAGSAEFGAARMNEIASIARACNATGNDFIADLVALNRGEAHKTLALLAKEPAELTRLANMNSRQRIAELAKMSVRNAAPAPAPAPAADPAPAKPAAPAPKGISKAPPPAPPIAPTGTREVTDWRSDDASEDEFTKGFNETFAKRMARR